MNWGDQIMLEMKVVKRGNSLALTVPKDSNFHLNDLWLAIPKSNNSGYTLVPKIRDPFKNAQSGEFYTSEEWSDINESEVD